MGEGTGSLRSKPQADSRSEAPSGDRSKVPCRNQGLERSPERMNSFASLRSNAASNFAHVFRKFHALWRMWTPDLEVKGAGQDPSFRLLSPRLLWLRA